jgi:hypothetical protein
LFVPNHLSRPEASQSQTARTQPLDLNQQKQLVTPCSKENQPPSDPERISKLDSMNSRMNNPPSIADADR